MDLHRWWLFVAAASLLAATPSPNMLHIIARSVQLGLRRTTMAMLGCVSASSWSFARPPPDDALLLAAPGAFAALRYAGAVYLLYLGMRSWRAEAAPPAGAAGAPARSLFGARVLRTGFITGISNPKLLLFAGAFLPQFVDSNMPQVPQYAVLVVTDVAINVFWCFTYALGGRSISRCLTRPVYNRLFNRATGVIFLGFGFSLLMTKLSG